MATCTSAGTGAGTIIQMPQVAISCGHAYINKVGGLAAAQLLSFLCQASLSQSGQPSHSDDGYQLQVRAVPTVKYEEHF